MKKKAGVVAKGQSRLQTKLRRLKITPYGPANQKKKVYLKELQQDPYQSVDFLSVAGARRKLIKLGLLRERTPKVITCWRCGAMMRRHAQNK